MHELFISSYYWLDLAVGFGFPLLLLALYRTNRISHRTWKFFWVGFAIGLAWEIPIFLLSRHTSFPIIYWIRETPIHYLFFMISHTLWDGGLFVTGYWLAIFFLRKPHYEKFRFSEFLILVLWGQGTAFLVEFSAATNNAWAFIDTYHANPVLLPFGDHSVTAMMQVIWLVATVVFYLLAMQIKK